jgi:hypothetical protein
MEADAARARRRADDRVVAALGRRALRDVFDHLAKRAASVARAGRG